jgi:hypothetical protein
MYTIRNEREFQMMIDENMYTSPGEGLRLRYSEAEIKAAVAANVEAQSVYREKVTAEIKKRLGTLDISIEKIQAFAESDYMNFGGYLDENAQTIVHLGRQLRSLDSNIRTLKLILERGVFSPTNAIDKLLSFQEWMGLIVPFSEEDFLRRFPRGLHPAMGLGTAMGSGRRFGARDVGGAPMSIDEALKTAE